MWRALDRALLRLYAACGALAAVCLIVLAGLVVASIASRLLGIYLPGVIEYSGYAMAASSFLAFAYAFRHGSHIRVNLVLNRLGEGPRRVLELWCLGVAGAIGLFLAVHSVKLAWVSYDFQERSEGADAVLLYIPQSVMAAGSVVFALCLCHHFLRVLSRADRGAPEAEGAG